MDCAPQNLATLSNCFCGNQNSQLEVYLLALVAGANPDPQVLATASAGLAGLSYQTLLQIQVFLLCGILNIELSVPPAPVEVLAGDTLNATNGSQAIFPVDAPVESNWEIYHSNLSGIGNPTTNPTEWSPNVNQEPDSSSGGLASWILPSHNTYYIVRFKSGGIFSKWSNVIFYP